MSPEQARGQAVDARTDVWAFGCVLYEMIVGRSAFGGATVSDTIAKFLERDPDWQALPPSTPSSIRRLLGRCLEKDPKRRLHAIADVNFDLQDARAESEHQRRRLSGRARAPYGSSRHGRSCWHRQPRPGKCGPRGARTFRLRASCR